MNRCFIVADDFTGANDTGVQLTRRGFRTKVVLKPEGVEDDGLSYVLDTESRNIPGEEASEKVARLLAGLDLSGFDCVIKKVDSTLRGNIAEEIQETDRVYGSELVIFMPALPALGRTTKDSVHRLNGVRIGLTELAHDPRKPVKQDNIAAILRGAYDEPVGALAPKGRSVLCAQSFPMPPDFRIPGYVPHDQHTQGRLPGKRSKEQPKAGETGQEPSHKGTSWI